MEQSDQDNTAKLAQLFGTLCKRMNGHDIKQLWEHKVILVCLDDCQNEVYLWKEKSGEMELRKGIIKGATLTMMKLDSTAVDVYLALRYPQPRKPNMTSTDLLDVAKSISTDTVIMGSYKDATMQQTMDNITALLKACGDKKLVAEGLAGQGNAKAQCIKTIRGIPGGVRANRIIFESIANSGYKPVETESSCKVQTDNLPLKKRLVKDGSLSPKNNLLVADQTMSSSASEVPDLYKMKGRPLPDIVINESVDSSLPEGVIEDDDSDYINIDEINIVNESSEMISETRSPSRCSSGSDRNGTNMVTDSSDDDDQLFHVVKQFKVQEEMEYRAVLDDDGETDIGAAVMEQCDNGVLACTSGKDKWKLEQAVFHFETFDLQWSSSMDDTLTARFNFGRAARNDSPQHIHMCDVSCKCDDNDISDCVESECSCRDQKSVDKISLDYGNVDTEIEVNGDMLTIRSDGESFVYTISSYMNMKVTDEMILRSLPTNSGHRGVHVLYADDKPLALLAKFAEDKWFATMGTTARLLTGSLDVNIAVESANTSPSLWSGFLKEYDLDYNNCG